MSTALNPVFLGVLAALTGDAQFNAAVPGGVHDTHAPGGTPFDYVTVDSPNEAPQDYIGLQGNAVAFALHIWTKSGADHEIGARKIFAIYQHIERLLNRQTLALTGATHHTGRTSLITALVDPDDPDRRIMHGVVRYQSLSTA